MAQEMVVKESLSAEIISAGSELILRLDKERFIVSAALWFYLTDYNAWRFIIASPEVRVEGPRKAYKKIQSVISRMPEDKPKIPLKDITIVDSNDQLISLLRVAIKTDDIFSPIRFSRNTINLNYIEDTYIYRLK
jgi:hypothetical protein